MVSLLIIASIYVAIASSETKLHAPDRENRDEFGNAVAIYGDTVVVGSYRDDDSYSDSGILQSIILQNS